eukprot:2589512-Prymnesium_polylepis.1
MRQKKLREGGDKKGDVPPPPEGHHVLGKPNGGQTISGTRCDFSTPPGSEREGTTAVSNKDQQERIGTD